MENGIEKKEPTKKAFFVKQPRRGRNVFGKYDPSRYEPDTKFVSSFSKVKTPVPTVPPPAPTAPPAPPAKTPVQNLVQYPTLAYPGVAKQNLVSYPIMGATTLPPPVVVPVLHNPYKKNDERDAISEMFDL